MTTETAIRLTEKMYEARDAAKFMLGDRFEEVMALYGRVISDLAAKRKISMLSAASDFGKEVMKEGDGRKEAIVIIASVVELMEPSQ